MRDLHPDTLRAAAAARNTLEAWLPVLYLARILGRRSTILDRFGRTVTVATWRGRDYYMSHRRDDQ